MPVNSKAKGGRGEREWAKWLRENLGINARRGVQYAGDPEAPDVVSDLTEINWEVKRVERLNIDLAMAQSIEDAGEEKIPVVAHRKNGRPWLITVMACDFKNICKYVNEETGDVSA